MTPMTAQPTDPRVESALRGQSLFGDDFSPAEIEAWFRDEVNGYASLDHLDSQSDHYAYHAMDGAYVWRNLPAGQLNVLGLGSAYGSEFRPIAQRIGGLTVVEPAEKFWRQEIAGIPARYLSPNPDGTLPLDTNSFDLVTAFGVLHHIPNVSAVLGELARVLRPGGLLAIREPATSMGDWRQPRRGLTSRERGIPSHLMAQMVAPHRCKPLASQLVGFGPLVNIASRRHGAAPWNSAAFVAVDRCLSALFKANYSYHRTRFLKRFAPTVGIWLFTKSATAQK